MEPGGRLTVRADWAPAPDGGPAGRSSGARRIKVEVEDTGIGIATADATKIFTPFFTTKTGGTGLGLALAHKIAEDHGGTLGFTSAPGVGTTFVLFLPLAAAPRVEVARSEDLG
jgi:signal transduction histidine kinase